MGGLPETQGERERHRLRVVSASLFASGLAAGVCEGLLSDASVLGASALMTWGSCALVPLVVLGAQPLLPIIWRVWSLGYSWWKILAFLGVVLLLVGGAGAGWYVWWKGIILSAIDYRPLGVLGAWAATLALAWWCLLRTPRLVRVALPLLLALGLASSVAAAWTPRRAAEAVEGLAQRGAALRWPAEQLQHLLDGDGDGYARALCVEVCDCNDQSAAISPAMAEIANNGLDDDCFEGDLRLTAAAVPLPASGPQVDVKARLRASAGPAVERPNVLLITIDTLRADHLGCYGYDRQTSPNLDALAAQGVRFAEPRAQGPMTRFSVPSLITGRYFSELKRTSGSWPVVLPENVTMAELLRDAGYHTAAFHSIGYLVPLYGFSQGFERYDVTAVRERDPVHWNRTSDLVTDQALRYFDETIAELPASQPWFVWAYYGDPHSGYVRHDDLPSFGPTIFDVYDQEILFTDIQIARLLEGLRSRGELGVTVVIVTSDHGEGLDPALDHGLQYHGQTLYDNLLKVPLIMQGPGVQPRVLEQPVGNIDVLPTVLELTGVDRPSHVRLQGVSLVPYLYGLDFPHPPVFSEKVTVQQHPQKSMIAWPWKLIWTIGPNRFELYNLADDPGELEDRAKEEAEVLEQLKREIQVWRAATLREIPAVDAEP